MPITEILEQNCEKFGNDVALVEINPDIQEKRRVTWKEYELIEPNTMCSYRREITWNVFNEKANRFANMLISRGVKKGDKVAILLMRSSTALTFPKAIYLFSVRNLSDVLRKSLRISAKTDSFSM